MVDPSKAPGKGNMEKGIATYKEVASGLTGVPVTASPYVLR